MKIIKDVLGAFVKTNYFSGIVMGTISTRPDLAVVEIIKSSNNMNPDNLIEYKYAFFDFEDDENGNTKITNSPITHVLLPKHCNADKLYTIIQCKDLEVVERYAADFTGAIVFDSKKNELIVSETKEVGVYLSNGNVCGFDKLMDMFQIPVWGETDEFPFEVYGVAEESKEVRSFKQAFNIYKGTEYKCDAFKGILCGYDFESIIIAVTDGEDGWDYDCDFDGVVDIKYENNKKGYESISLEDLMSYLPSDKPVVKSRNYKSVVLVDYDYN